MSGYVSEAKLAKLKHINVLVIDHDPRIADLVRRVLLSLGFGAIYMAKNGKEGLDILRDKPIDLAITEWEMEPMSGIDFINFIRTSDDSPNRTLPIIMLTGKAQRRHVEKARDTGMTEFVVKPFSVRTLCDRIILVVEHPRNFILSSSFCGPDRRRRVEPMNAGDERRQNMKDDSLVVAENENSRVFRLNEEDITVIDPDFGIQEKLGKDISITELFSQENVKRAQHIINHSQGDFLEWVVKDIKMLEESYDTLAANPGHDSRDVRELYLIALKIKSQAGTFGFDLASSVAESLVAITEECPHVDNTRKLVVRKHIDVLYVIFQRNIQGMGGKIGKDLMDSLSQLTQKYKIAN